MKTAPFRIAGIIAAGFLILGSGTVARSSVITFTSRATFLSQVGGATNIDFEGIAPAGGFVFSNDNTGFTLDGVKFTGNNDNDVNYRLYIIDAGYSDAGYHGPTGDILSGPGDLAGASGYITAVLPAGIRAVGAELFPYAGIDTTLTAKLSTGEEINLANGNDTASDPHNAKFAGFVNMAADITSITFRVPADTTPDSLINLDNFVFATQVPEPASLSLLLGLAGTTLAGRRRRH
jgi:hypothetical protein